MILPFRCLRRFGRATASSWPRRRLSLLKPPGRPATTRSAGGALRLWALLFSGQAPLADRAIGAGGERGTPVRRDRHRQHFVGVQGEAMQLLAGADIPKADRLVLAARYQPLTSGGESQTPHRTRMTLPRLEVT